MSHHNRKRKPHAAPAHPNPGTCLRPGRETNGGDKAGTPDVMAAREKAGGPRCYAVGSYTFNFHNGATHGNDIQRPVARCPAGQGINTGGQSCHDGQACHATRDAASHAVLCPRIGRQHVQSRRSGGRAAVSETDCSGTSTFARIRSLLHSAAFLSSALFIIFRTLSASCFFVSWRARSNNNANSAAQPHSGVGPPGRGMAGMAAGGPPNPASFKASHIAVSVFLNRLLRALVLLRASPESGLSDTRRPLLAFLGKSDFRISVPRAHSPDPARLSGSSGLAGEASAVPAGGAKPYHDGSTSKTSVISRPGSLWLVCLRMTGQPPCVLCLGRSCYWIDSYRGTHIKGFWLFLLRRLGAGQFGPGVSQVGPVNIGAQRLAWHSAMRLPLDVDAKAFPQALPDRARLAQITDAGAAAQRK